MNERGTALIEMLVLAFAVALVVIPAFTAVGRIMEARVAVDDAAHDVGVWVARHGAAHPGTHDDVEVDVQRTPDSVEVTAVRRVDLAGIGSATVGMTIRSTVRVPVSPYRSGR